MEKSKKAGLFAFVKVSAALVLLLSLVSSPPAAAAASDLGSFFEPVPAALEASARSRLDAKYLVPVGRTAGIKIYAGGVVILEFSDIDTPEGKACPARECGLLPGDIVAAVGGVTVKTTPEFQGEIAKHSGRPAALEVSRDGKTLSLTVTPLCGVNDSTARIGALVRDSMAGIGTITFYDPESGVFGSLGHGIGDSSTGSLMPLGSGALLPSSVSGVNKGEPGKAGSLIGSFDTDKNCGSLNGNHETGLFGTLGAGELYPELMGAEPLPVAKRGEVKTGKAYILSNVAGERVEKYEIEIIKIINSDRSTKNMHIRITDKLLLSQTGGIVQGMSGSPIIQNGKIVGAVTHVLVNDPASGYGIFIENMLDNALPGLRQTAAGANLRKAA